MPSIWKLRLSMIASLAIIFTLSTLILAVILSLFQLGLIYIGIFVIAFNLLQWLISPYIIDALYRVKEIPKSENPKLHEMIDNLSRKSGIKKPKLMLAHIPIPNAFAYGSPIAGNRVAVTSGLLKTLNDDEVEAVIGHELGHLKHRDVQVMMLVSLLPALFYYIGYSIMMSSMYGRQREEGSGTALLGMGLVAFSMFLTYVCVSFLSRVREYYADRHSATIVEDGARKLSVSLAKIVNTTKNMRKARKEVQNLNAFKALFIADPDRAEAESIALSTMAASSDQKLVQEILSQKLTALDRISEMFSTHPNIVKRLRALQELS
ncbi:MAG: M48 family metalloprotease [Candidatus Bathyarchaeota archaeon]|nr:M48 family metalloprotease [Candidatus Bathyarchaeota archaeon A05DMB-3]MDH7606609.1 M48 family metalloprotease [Candidatus Bathyarchaeota archaeon]